jgi:predicted negative regulator of RcsB-dependent stress response
MSRNILPEGGIYLALDLLLGWRRFSPEQRTEHHQNAGRYANSISQRL